MCFSKNSNPSFDGATSGAARVTRHTQLTTRHAIVNGAFMVK
jgi:hypothetical protein